MADQKPNALLKLTKSKHTRPDEPEFVGGFGSPPSDLAGVALVKWLEITPFLEELGIGSLVERGPMRILCLAYAAHQQATETIERLGDVLESERGFTRNPACLNQNAAAGTIAKLSAQFGLTPTSRGKLPGSNKKDSNPFATI